MNQLLALARQEAVGEATLSMRRVDLRQLVQQAIADVLPQAQALSTDLGLLPSTPAQVVGDPDALLVLLRNLLENAIKYTPAHGRIDVQVRDQDGATCLTIDDSGPGIAPTEREHVFDRFFRGHTSGPSGSGLGLAIARAIALRHHVALRLGDSATLGGLRVELLFPPQAKD